MTTRLRTHCGCPGRLAVAAHRAARCCAASANGFGLLALSGLLAEEAAAAPDASAAAAAAFRPEGQERHLLLHGRRRLARRFVRPQAEARRARRQGRSPSRRTRPPTATASGSRARGRSSSTASAGMPVSELFPHIAAVRRRPGRHPLDEGRPAAALDRRAVPAHRASTTPAGRASARGSPTAWAARTATCPASSSSASASCPAAAWRTSPAASCRPATRRRCLQADGTPIDNIRPGRQRPPHPAGQARPARASRTRRSRARWAATTPSSRRSATTRWPTACSRSCPTCSTWAARPRRRRSSTASTRTVAVAAALRHPVPAGPAAGRVGRALRRDHLPARRVQRHLGPARQPEEGPREERPRHRPGRSPA